MSAALHPDLCFLPVAELSQQLRSKKITSTALTEAYLERITAFAEKLHCFVTVTADLARADAKRADAEIAAGRWRGPLHGIPYGLKDLIDTKGIRTTWGATPFAERVPDADATVYRRLRDAGAVLLGKLSMIELAGGLGYHWADAALNGACRTPWDLDRWAGGSSSGAGSAVAAGLVGFAIGSETWGSIVCPSAFCGVSGLRPTYGAVSRAGAMALSWSFDKLGPLCRSAFDTALVLAVIAGKDPADPASVDAPSGGFAVTGHGARGMRIGWADVPAGTKWDGEHIGPLHDAVRESLKDLGAAVETVALPDLPVVPAALAILGADVRAAFEQFLAEGKQASLADRSHHEGKTLDGLPDPPGSLYVKAQRVRRLAVDAFSALFTRFDAIVGPNYAAPAPRVARNIDEQIPDFPGLDVYGAICGLPALAFPVGFVGGNPAAGEQGLPISMQALGKPFAESQLVSLVAAWQQKTRWHLERPKLFA